MTISLIKALTEERAIALGRGVTVRVRPVGFARFSRLNTEALIRAQAELAAQGEDATSSHAVAALSQAHLDRALVLESLTGWEGVVDAAGAPAPLTPETWALFAELHPDLATVAIAEIRSPGILAAAEGNGSAPSPNGAQAGAPSTAGPAPSSPAPTRMTPASPAPATAARAPARRRRTAP